VRPPLRPDDDREDVESSETWTGGAGTVTFNWLQQHKEGFDPATPPTPLEEAETTDPWGISG
jgi:hypothetical protein